MDPNHKEKEKEERRMNLGQGLKLGRVLRDMNQETLAEKLGIRRGYVSLIERGVKKGSVAAWQAAPAAFELSPSAFLLLCAEPEDHEHLRPGSARRLADLLFEAVCGYSGFDNSEPDVARDLYPAPTSLIQIKGCEPLEL